MTIRRDFCDLLGPRTEVTCAVRLAADQYKPHQFKCPATCHPRSLASLRISLYRTTAHLGIELTMRQFVPTDGEETSSLATSRKGEDFVYASGKSLSIWIEAPLRRSFVWLNSAKSVTHGGQFRSSDRHNQITFQRIIPQLESMPDNGLLVFKLRPTASELAYRSNHS